MQKKKLMLLGGLRYLIPVIESAHQLGVHVITVDNVPGNIAHKYSDEHHYLSIVEQEEILNLARQLQINGIMSFAVDPGVVTASYVAEKMGLPFAGSYDSVRILQNKDLFRQFLSDHGFNVPLAGSYKTCEEAKKDIKRFGFPLIVKPTDSAGSKGVTRIDSEEELEHAFAHALGNSISGNVIIEQFIEKRGCSSDSDSFTVDGKFVVTTFSAQRFDSEAENPYTPSAYSWPSTFTEEEEAYLSAELQRLAHLLHLGTSIYNIETRIGTDGKPYIMEVSPRGGGNRLAAMTRYATGTDMIMAAVKAALGIPFELKQNPLNGHWAEVVLHSEEDGIFDGLEISEDIAANVVEEDLWVKPGDRIHAFRGANDAIGTLVLRFDNADTLEATLQSIRTQISLRIKY